MCSEVIDGFVTSLAWCRGGFGLGWQGAVGATDWLGRANLRLILLRSTAGPLIRLLERVLGFLVTSMPVQDLLLE